MIARSCRSSLAALTFVAATTTALSGAVSSPSFAAEPVAAEAAPIAQAPANHGIADLIALVQELRSEGRVSAGTASSLLDRLQRALGEEQTGSEVRTLNYLRQFAARAENQVRDVAARAELVAAAQRSIAWLEQDDRAEAAAVPTTILLSSFRFSSANELSSEVEVQCEQGYTYTVSGFATTLPPLQYAGWTLNTTTDGTATGTCDGEVQHLDLSLELTVGSSEVRPQEELSATFVLELSGGPCYRIDAWPYTNCVAVAGGVTPVE